MQNLENGTADSQANFLRTSDFCFLQLIHVDCEVKWKRKATGKKFNGLIANLNRNIVHINVMSLRNYIILNQHPNFGIGGH